MLRPFQMLMKAKALWYANSNEMIEIAVNQGNAAELLELKVGSHILLST